MSCSHVKTVEAVTAHTAGCEECLKSGSSWVHLRLCLTCGHVGCCETTNGHALAHSKASNHPLIRELPVSERSFTWCYGCNAYVS